jgi:hypothetical protein
MHWPESLRTGKLGASVTAVTAAIGWITIERPPMEICDHELSGQVSYGVQNLWVSYNYSWKPPSLKEERELQISCMVIR